MRSPNDTSDFYYAVDLRDCSRISRPSCLEKFGYTRKTTSNITGFSNRFRNSGKDGSRLDISPFGIGLVRVFCHQ